MKLASFIPTILIATIPALIAAVVGYLVARRSTSGKITNSDASDLWQESQAMRKELRDEVKELRDIIADLRQHVDELEKQEVIDREKILELTNKVRMLEGRVKELEAKL